MNCERWRTGSSTAVRSLSEARTWLTSTVKWESSLVADWDEQRTELEESDLVSGRYTNRSLFQSISTPLYRFLTVNAQYKRRRCWNRTWTLYGILTEILQNSARRVLLDRDNYSVDLTVSFERTNCKLSCLFYCFVLGLFLDLRCVFRDVSWFARNVSLTCSSKFEGRHLQVRHKHSHVISFDEASMGSFKNVPRCSSRNKDKSNTVPC